MESNVIRWLNNSHDSILESILIVSKNNYFISKPNLIEFASKNNSYIKKVRKGLNKEQYDILKNQILNVLPSYYLNNNSNDNEIIYSYNIGKENNLKFESAIRQLIENNIILNQHHFIKINNENNQNNKDLINSINNNNFNPNSNSISIDLSKLQEIQQESLAPGVGNSFVKSRGPSETTVIELVPNTRKEYFNKNIPLEISKQMDAKKYHSFISKLNSTYSGDLFISLYIAFYIISLFMIIFIGIFVPSENGTFIYVIIFSVVTVCFFTFLIIYSLKIKYYLISRIIRKKNLKLIKNNSPLEFVLVHKQVKYPQTKNNMTLQILVIKPDYAGVNNNSLNNNNNNKELTEDIINETININLNKLNNVDNI